MPEPALLLGRMDSMPDLYEAWLSGSDKPLGGASTPKGRGTFQKHAPIDPGIRGFAPAPVIAQT
jgi:hypothetical protein